MIYLAIGWFIVACLVLLFMKAGTRTPDLDACDVCGGSKRVDGGPCVLCKGTGDLDGSTGDWEDAADVQYETRRDLQHGL